MLINNAGVMTRPVSITELEVKKWDYTIAVNLRGPFLVTQAVLPIDDQTKSGSIINVSSSLWTQRLRQLHRLRDFQVGLGRLHADTRRRR